MATSLAYLNEAMEATKQLSKVLLFLALTTLIINPSNAADCIGNGTVSSYWGEGDGFRVSLEDKCDSGNYTNIIIEHLAISNNGEVRGLDIPYCAQQCTILQSQIENCQKKNVKIFLSIVEIVSTTATVSSMDEDDKEKKLADYLLTNFLRAGPLGSVTLDGIDLGDVSGSNLNWDKIVEAISTSTLTERKVYLSASPKCDYPNQELDVPIKNGRFDYIWVRFYNSADCIYLNKNATNLLNTWETWTTNVPKSSIFLGLVTSDKVPGYIYPYELIDLVLPTVKQASNFGGIILWDKNYDQIANYVEKIKGSVSRVCQCVCNDPAINGFYGLHGSI